MSPLTRYTVAIVLTMAIWRPTLMDGIAGRVGLTTAISRFLVMFCAARLAMRLIGNLVDRYQSAPHRVGVDAATTTSPSAGTSASPAPAPALAPDR